MLQGMTNAEASDLVPLAKSWLHAPELTISAQGFKGGSYDPAERAYIVEKTTANDVPLELVIKASEESPLINPAFIIKNWGQQQATLSINGENRVQDENFRQGIRKGPEGDDLIVWIRLSSNAPITISLE